MSDAATTEQQQSATTEQQQTEQTTEQQQTNEQQTEQTAVETTEQATTETTEQAVAAETKPTPAAPDWRDRRIATLTARLRESERKAAAAPTDPAASAAITTTQDEISRLADARAAEIAAVNDFTRRCNEVAEAGNAEFADFSARVTTLKSLAAGGPAEELAYNQLLLAAIETGDGAKIIHRLGGDLNEASRIMSMSPVRMGIELARLAAKPEGEVSGAPRPIRPISPGGGSHDRIDPADAERSDRLTTAEWMARRQAQVNAAEAANGRR